ncbi:MAG: inorganic pyrophosphatase [Leadbetterella sp.]
MKINFQKAHPWHGIVQSDMFPSQIIAFVEIVPTDTVKYEIDKDSGFLRIDRVQKFSNLVPTLYGFVPRTYCGKRVAELAQSHTDLEIKLGDGDPLDVCILTSHSIAHGDILCNIRPIGGFSLVDKGEADDKIIGVLEGDPVYDGYNDIADLPKGIVKKLKHYFLTYKNLPDEESHCIIANEYGRERAHEVLVKSEEDYWELVKYDPK